MKASALHANLFFPSQHCLLASYVTLMDWPGHQGGPSVHSVRRQATQNRRTTTEAPGRDGAGKADAYIFHQLTFLFQLDRRQRRRRRRRRLRGSASVREGKGRRNLTPTPYSPREVRATAGECACPKRRAQFCIIRGTWIVTAAAEGDILQYPSFARQ